MMNKKQIYDNLLKQILNCCKCEICKYITHKVPGEGGLDAKIFFVGEAPGKKEDLTGRPFVGPAGQILRNLIKEVLKLDFEEVFITSVLKCRPPGNRDPKPEEIANCFPFLEKQIKIIDPTLIVALGRFAANTLLGTQLPMTKLRGKLFKTSKVGKPVFVTYHPAAAIYNPSLKEILKQDFIKIRQILDEFFIS